MSEAVMESEQTEAELVAPSTDGLGHEAEPSVDEFRQRVMTDGDFAIDQIRKRDQQSSKLANRVKALEPVEQLVSFAGGTDELMQLAQLGTRVQQSPELLAVIQNFSQTGRLEWPNAKLNGSDEEEEWIDPDVKKVRDAFREEIDDLRHKFNSLQQAANTTDVRSKEQRIKATIEAELAKFASVPEAFEEASETIMTGYQAALKKAERGDSDQSALLEQLYGPGGSDILEQATSKIFRKYAAKLVAASNAQSTNAPAVLMKSTDERKTNPARPGTPQLPPVPKGRVSDSFVADVLAAAKRSRGLV